MHKRLLFTSAVTLVVLVITVFALPTAFTACGKNSWWCAASWWLTQSGGKIGTAVILLGSAIIYALRMDGVKTQIFTFLKTIFVLGALIGIVAFINEHVTKELIRQPRPSHRFLTENNSRISLDSLYKVGSAKRQELLRELTKSDSPQLKNIDEDVLAHWVEEAGFSFPSGHSFNVFLLSVVISWTMFHSRVKALPYLFWLPSLWAFAVALSRVAIGAHSAWDVSFGALMGILLGYLFLYFDTTRKWITHRVSSK